MQIDIDIDIDIDIGMSSMADRPGVLGCESRSAVRAASGRSAHLGPACPGAALRIPKL